MRPNSVTTFLIPAFAGLFLFGCSQGEQNAEFSQSESAEAAGEDAAGSADTPDAEDGGPGVIKVARAPQIAYSYRYGFRLSADKISELQRSHADLCEGKGRNVCRILNMSQSGGEGDYASGSLQIEVAAKQARRFGDELTSSAEDAGGSQIDTSIEGEDLSKQIVDTQARLRSRILLRDRLMDILKNRTGKVSELVEAERGVAAVNEEIDRAQSWLAEMKGRVAFSKMTINYSAGSPSAGGFVEPIRQAIGSASAVLGSTIAFIINAIIFLLPWALLIGLILWTRKRFGWRFRFWENSEDTPKEDNGDTPGNADQS